MAPPREARHNPCMPTPRRKTILAVDDDPAFLALVVNWLEPEFAVLPMTDPEDLREAIQVHAPDLVLLDVHFPGLGGLDACRLLRVDPMLRSTPVVFVTSSRSDEDFIGHLESGGDLWLNKPLTKAGLRTALERLGLSPRTGLRR